MPSTPGKSFSWSPVEDRNLLVAIIKSLPPKALDTNKVAQYFGQGKTAKAIDHRIRRIIAMSQQTDDQEHSESASKQTQIESPKKRKLS